jgi:plastocyanin
MSARRSTAAALVAPALAAMVGLTLPAVTGAIDETAQRPPTAPVGSVHEVTVAEGSFAFTPQLLNIHPGDIVRWVNHDKENHLVVTRDPGGASTELLVYKTLKPGERYEHQFQRAETYNFFCAIHFQMWGAVTVAP